MRRGHGMKVIELTWGDLPGTWRRQRISQSGNWLRQRNWGQAEVSRGHSSRTLNVHGEGLNMSKLFRTHSIMSGC